MQMTRDVDEATTAQIVVRRGEASSVIRLFALGRCSSERYRFHTDEI